ALGEAAGEAVEDATEVAANFGGVAVAVDLARGAHALRPEHEFRRLRRRSRRRVGWGGPVALRVNQSPVRGPIAFWVSPSPARGTITFGINQNSVCGRIRIGQHRPARAERGRGTGLACIGRLPQAAQIRLSDVAAIIDDGRLRAAVDLARERIERL